MRTLPILLLAVAVAACGCTEERGVGTSEPNRTGGKEQVEIPVDKTPCEDPGLNGEAEEKAPPPEQTGKTPGSAIIDFEEINRLIPRLDSEDYQERKGAKEKLITIGRKSALHAETLGPYLLKCSEQEKSVHIRACLSEILTTLSSVSVSLIESGLSSDYGPRVPSLRQAIIIDNEVDLRGFDYRLVRIGVSTDFKNRFLLYVELGPYPHIPVEFRFISARRDFLSSVITVNVDADDTSRGVVRPMCTNVTGIFSIEQTSYPILVCHAKYKDSLSEPVKGITKSILLKATPWEARQLVKGEQTVEELKKLLGHENYFVRRDAVRALGKIATPGAISAVVEHLKSEKHGLVKRWCAIVLGRAGAKEAIPTLKAAFDPEWLRASEAFSEYIFWALIKLEAGGLEGRWAYNAYADNKFLPILRRGGWEYRLETKKDYNKLTDAKQLALLKRAADEFEARFLKETSDASSSIPGTELSEIDFKEVDRLIEQLDSDKGEQRDAAKEKLITIGRKSTLHAETLGPYLLKRSGQEDSPSVRACLSEVLTTLSSVSASLVTSGTCGGHRWSPDGATFLSATVFDTEVDFRFWFFRRYNHSKLGDLNLDFEKQFVLDVQIGSYPNIPIGFRLVSARRDFTSHVIAVGVDAGSTSKGLVRPMIADATGLIAIDRTSYPIMVYNVRYSDSLSEPVEGVIKSVSLAVSPEPAKQLVKGKQTVEELKVLLGHENYFVRRDAVRALGRIGTPEAISAIIEHLKSEKHGLVKRWCAIVLGRAGAKEAIPALEALFKQVVTAEAFKEYAFWALIKLEAEGVGKQGAYDNCAGDFNKALRRAGYYPEANLDPDIVLDEITDAEFLAMLRRSADEFEARYLKESPDITEENEQPSDDTEK